MNIVLLGPPGAGKGTQAASLSESYHLQWISTGDMLREVVATQGDMSEMIRAIMDKGGLIPDEIMLQMLSNRISIESKGKKNFLLDGFPRTLEQAHSLDGILKDQNLQLDAVIHIQLDDQHIVERISGRLYCADCGTGYHTVFHPPKQAGICDLCGSKNIVRRSDDSQSSIEGRLREHHEKTAPLLPYYRQRDLLYEVDGDGRVDVVQGRINEVIASFAANTFAGREKEACL